MNFKEWKKELKNKFINNNWPDDYVSQVHDSTWREAFDDGVTPQEMFESEASSV